MQGQVRLTVSTHDANVAANLAFVAAAAADCLAGIVPRDAPLALDTEPLAALLRERFGFAFGLDSPLAAGLELTRLSAWQPLTAACRDVDARERSLAALAGTLAEGLADLAASLPSLQDTFGVRPPSAHFVRGCVRCKGGWRGRRRRWDVNLQPPIAELGAHAAARDDARERAEPATRAERVAPPIAPRHALCRGSDSL